MSPGDLALTTNDQLVMAALWGLLVVVILAFVWGLGMRAAFFTVVFAHSVRWTINSVALVAVVAGLSSRRTPLS